ncbi:MAG: FAD-linked oxidase C-terminal domain-containing protein [Burkholderiaceae bacterium]
MFDAASRGRYATDASIYQVNPVGVVVPRDDTDVMATLDIASDMKVPVLPRGAGTSQCGQTVGEALVIDTSHFLREITDLDTTSRTVTVQPGVVLDDLNAQLKPHGLWFPVDVSTSAQATLGGMAGNNSCGSRSIAYGNMVHNVLGIDALLADGTEQFFGPFGEDNQVPLSGPRASELVSRLFEIGARERNEIAKHWPRVLRRVGGYNLDVFFPQSPRPYTDDGEVNLAHLLVGSEGTLAYSRRLHLKLSPLPRHKALGVVNFASFHAAMDSAQHIVRLGPCAVELVDRTMIDLARENPAFRSVIETALTDSSAPTPEAILLVEFAGDDAQVQREKLADLADLMSELGLPGTVVSLAGADEQKALWEVRKAGLNIMMSLKGDGKPVSFIEDCAVPLEHLAEYTSALTEVFERHGTRGTWYAHASVGTLHVRPILDMRRGGAERMRAIAIEASDLVRKFKGAYSGEHGDGLVRSEWVAWQFGPRLNRAFEQMKDAFDPLGLMNPGKIVRSPKMDDTRLFRFRPGYTARPVETALDWSAWNVQADPQTEVVSPAGSGDDPSGGFAKAVEMCNNNGHCRKFDAGAMCPSFRVTRQEQHLTRGRANTLRLAVSGQLPGGLGSQDVREAMDLCVGCKACKRECPTGVDMARMKIEVAYQSLLGRDARMREKLVAHLPRYAPILARLAWLANLRSAIPGLPWLGEKLLGISARRSLPRFRSDTFFRSRRLDGAPSKAGATGKEVVLWVDTFSNAFEREVADAAVVVLEVGGYQVHIASPLADDPDSGRGLCCGRTYLAAGMVGRARLEAERTLRSLQPFLDRDLPVIGLEPSCLFTMRDEFTVMELGDGATRLAKQAVLLEEFLAGEIDAGRLQLKLKPISAGRALLHGHCHQKAFGAMGAVERVLSLVPGLVVETIDSSCCGMAGAFGYEAEHIDVSIKMAEQALLPAVRAADNKTIIVADGTSCRHQIADGTSRHARHVAQILAEAL